MLLPNYMYVYKHRYVQGVCIGTCLLRLIYRNHAIE